MSDTEMKVNPARAKELVSQLQDVQQRIAAVAKGRPVRLLHRDIKSLLFLL